MKHASSPMQIVWAVLPIKDLVGVKSRLEGSLSSEERKGLVHAMAEDVLLALQSVDGLSGIAVVGHDKEVAAWTKAHDLTLIDDSAASSLSEAVRVAANELKTQGADAILSVLADTPLAKPSDFEALLRRSADAAGQPSLTLAPSRDGDGSNAMVIAPPDAIEFHYGKGSAIAHKAEAVSRHLVTSVLDLDGIGHDIDTRQDLLDLVQKMQQLPGQSKTKQFLTKSGIAGRLA
jgi:2-phospho-L-lactate/phosphoenolpyruvate guanylyltransferase